MGIISDTHDNIKYVQKAVQIFKEHNVEAVIHAGDLISPFMVDYFQPFAPNFYLCSGNNKGDTNMIKAKMQTLGKFFADVGVFSLAGKEFIVYHGTIPTIVNAFLTSQQYDYIITGHTHQKRIHSVGRTTLINPGKAFFDPKQPDSTIAILNTANNEVKFFNIEID